MATVGSASSEDVLEREVLVSSNAIGKGSTAPTDVTVAAGPPEVKGLLFDAVNETATIFINLPEDMDTSVDPRFHVVCSLVSAQTDLDTLDWSYDYIVITDGVPGEGPGKTATSVTSSLVVTTAEGLAVDDVYLSTLTIDAADATNPLAGAEAIILELHLTNVTGVASIHVLQAHMHYTAKY